MLTYIPSIIHTVYYTNIYQTFYDTDSKCYKENNTHRLSFTLYDKSRHNKNIDNKIFEERVMKEGPLLSDRVKCFLATYTCSL